MPTSSIALPRLATAATVARGPDSRHCRGGATEEAEHRRHLGRRRRLHQPQRLQSRRHGLPHAEHRSHCERRRGVHRSLCASVLHRRARRVHYRHVSDPHGPDVGGHGRGAGGPAGPRRHARRGAEDAVDLRRELAVLAAMAAMQRYLARFVGHPAAAQPAWLHDRVGSRVSPARLSTRLLTPLSGVIPAQAPGSGRDQLPAVPCRARPVPSRPVPSRAA